MPITSSAKKALRQSLKRREVNRVWKEKMKDAIKKALADKKPETISFAQKIVDKAVKKGLLQKNTAARIKSKISRQSNPLK